MTVYAIALLSIHDRARYDRYAAAFMPVLRTYGGRVLAADDRPEVAEGQWSGNRVVVLEFPDRDAFTSWSTSPEYLDIAKDRLAAASTDVLVVRGSPSSGLAALSGSAVATLARRTPADPGSWPVSPGHGGEGGVSTASAAPLESPRSIK